MKQFLFHIVVFFAIIIVIDIFFGIAIDWMGENAKSGDFKQLLDLSKHDQYDMLIMGSSKARHNYIPRIISDSLDMTCYNAGYDGNGIILAYGILSMIEDNLLPKIIIYDVKQQFDTYHYNEDGDYTRYYKKLKLFYGHKTVNEIIGNISGMDLLKMRSNLYRVNGDLSDIVNGFLRTAVDNNCGYIPMQGVLMDESEAIRDYTSDIDSLKIGYFKRFVSLTKEKGIELIVVISPEYNTPFSADFQPVRDICKNENIILMDYFTDPSFQVIEYFKDHCHLNEDGAVLFSATLTTNLRRIRGMN